MWGATGGWCDGSSGHENFNPRTPCGVRPLLPQPPQKTRRNFNPRTPCGVRQYTSHGRLDGWGFQSTHPVWGATWVRRRWWPCVRHFNPRTPCGVRHKGRMGNLPGVRFQSTHPVWGATSGSMFPWASTEISIHAPRVGCDMCIESPQKNNTYFNPRTPCGVRHDRKGNFVMEGTRFQSTHPVWGATVWLL